LNVRRLLPLLVAAAAALAAAAPAAAQESRRVPPLFYGANWDGDVEKLATDQVRWTQNGRMAESGVETVRVSFEWARAQARKGAPFDHRVTDRIVLHAAAHGLDVMPVVILAPKWARRYDNVAHSPPKNVKDYVAYLRSLIRRYGPDGTFWLANPTTPKLPIRFWQIWNEPHLQYQWSIPTGMDWAPGYGQLLRAAYRGVKAQDPGASVVLGGMTNRSWEALDHLYRKGGGVRGSFDVAALHPYTSKADGVITLLKRFRIVLKRFKDAKLPVWVTELGLPASKGRFKNDSKLQTTDRGMAAFLERGYRLLSDQWRKSHGAQRVYWYNWASTYCCEQFRFTGLFGYDPYKQTFEEKPAYEKYVAAARRDEGCEKNSIAQCTGAVGAGR
jgi:hypothetical protein